MASQVPDTGNVNGEFQTILSLVAFTHALCSSKDCHTHFCPVHGCLHGLITQCAPSLRHAQAAANLAAHEAYQEWHP